MATMRRLKRSAPRWRLLVAVGIILVAGWAQSQAADPPKPLGQSSKGQQPPRGGSDPQYLIFWGEAQRALDVRTHTGTAGDGKSRLLGFGSVNAPFDMTDDQLRDRIHTAFQTAKQNNIAEHFCYDFHHFWEKRPELWNWFDPAQPGYNPANKDNVEWSDWQGTPSKARYLDWGTPQKLSPQMCYNCPAIRREITRVVTQVIGPALKSELELLEKGGQAYLFAGITVGGEPQLDDYSAIDKINPALGKFIEQDGAAKVQFGYHALINRGYSAAHPPKDVKQALAEVNQDFVAFCAKQFVDAGISPSRLYTHVAAPFDKIVAFTNAPLWIAFNEYSRPGWTTYPVGDLAFDFQPIYSQLKKHKDPPWGGVEANLGFADSSVASWEGYLERHFNHGAKVVGINVGATGQDLPGRLERSAFGPEALAAYKKFLSGERLEADPLPLTLGVGSGPSPLEIQRKMEQVQAEIQRWQKEGRDPSAVVQLMQQVPPLMQTMRFREAGTLMDRALRLIKQPALPAPTGPPVSLQRKMQCLEGLVQKWQQEGKDLQPVGEIMQGFQPLVEQQKFAEAERLADQALHLLGGACPQLQEGTPGVGPPASLQQKGQRLQHLVEQRQQAGADLRPVVELMQGFDPLMQQGKFSEAEALVDRALKLLGEPEPPAPPPGTASGVVPPALQEKMARLWALAQQRQQAGADMQPVVAITEGIQPLLQQQKFSEAEALVDRALKLLGGTAATESRSPAGEPSVLAYGGPDVDGRQQIFLVNTDGTGKRRLTRTGKENYFPAWFPDGKRLVWVSDHSGSLQIWVMDTDGANPTQLTTQGNNLIPACSPDGKKISFTSDRTGAPEIWVMDADGTNQKQLTSTSISPDNSGYNRMLLDFFVRLEAMFFKLNATAAGVTNTFASWSPDSRRIAFCSTRGGDYAIWMMDADGSHPTRLTSPVGICFPFSNAPVFSPDGQKIVFWSGVNLGPGRIWVMNADGSDRKQLTDQSPEINDDEPTWSADGSKILFDTDRPGSGGIGIWIMEPDGSNQRVLVTQTGIKSRPAWQPVRGKPRRSE